MSGMTRAIPLLALAAVISPLPACYRYSLSSLDTLAPGATVRARLSPAEADRVGEILGRDDRVIEGQLLESNDSSAIIAVRSLAQAEGTGFTTAFQRIDVHRSSVVELEVRRFDRTKTMLFVGGSVATASAIVAGAFAARRGGSGGDKPKNENVRTPPPMLIPLVRVSIGR